ncbi:MAG: RagB/SusD family nutrient uptake outer membrane protein, partial [Flavobacterium sp.]
MYKYLILFFLLVSFQSQAQYIISGKVVDDKTKKNISGVSIYINNTTVGTLTDENGSFKIYTPSAGKIELVFSHVSYKKKIVVKEVDNNVDIKVELLVANNILSEVVIRGNKDSKAVRKKWIDVFTRNLIGNYPIVSLRCKIKNPEVLYFNYERKDGKLEVFATKPILIENTALGYVNQLRTRAYNGSTVGNISSSALTTDFILDERGRELWYEAFRRTDLIRFNKYTTVAWWDHQPSTETRKLFPIP